MTTSETERSMLDRLNVRYAGCGGNGIFYTRAEHVKVAAGHWAPRTCDYMAMDIRPGYGPDRGPKLHGHEVKVSRADWLTELRSPEKAEAFARYCDYWWLAVSDKSIVRDDLPDGWGLLIAHGRSLRVARQASLRTPVPMGRDLQATFSRAVTKTTLRLAGTDDRAVKFMSARMKLGNP